jgi:aspartate aminotransferase-like enzyme
MKSAPHAQRHDPAAKRITVPAGLAQPARSRREVCLLPGPVALSAAVRAALQIPPLYHRAEEFVTLFEDVRARLGTLVGGRDVALFLGSGTLANEVVAATLAVAPGPGRGLILSNGEFGSRLFAQAVRFGLTPRVLTWPWGSPWNLDELARALDKEPAGSWVWGVHHESSTGVLNDLAALVEIARLRGVRVCADFVSSLGAVPVDLSHVYLASGTSGKALGSVAGVAMVFADRHKLGPLDPARVPSYLDLPETLSSVGPRFTFPSGPLCGLAAALNGYSPERAAGRYADYFEVGEYIRRQLRSVGLSPLARECDAGPTICTFAPWAGWTSEAFVEDCRRQGFLIGGASSYLAERRLVQIANMGAITRSDCAPLFEHLSTARSSLRCQP